VTSPVPAAPRIDAHLHVWDLEVSEYAWLTPDFGPLHATFAPETARAELDVAGIDAAVLVQAEDSERDTGYLLDVATRHTWVAGVVGWVALDDPARAARQLHRWQQHPAFCGVRHLVHDDPRDDFLALPSVRDSLREIAARGLAFDVPDAWPRHLSATADLAGAVPELRVVVDHLAKPPAAPAEFDRWRRTLRQVAALPNTVAKLSGLQRPGEPFTVGSVRPAWDVALELFGPSRLMYGGDWPMTVLAGGYQPVWQVTATLLGELSPAEQARLLAGTATEVYGLQRRAAPGGERHRQTA
jgi:L-fuconolactonase